MIPKILHYCWFGNKQKPAVFNECYNSWKTYLPDWTFIEWNETTFPVRDILRTNLMYEMREYAYVADYVRLYAIYHYGGVYFDTDVILHRSIEDLLKEDKATFVFENKNLDYINNAIIFSTPKHQLFQHMLSIMDYHVSNLDTTTYLLNYTAQNTICRDLHYQYSNINYLKNEEFIAGNSRRGSYGNHLATNTWVSEDPVSVIIIGRDLYDSLKACLVFIDNFKLRITPHIMDKSEDLKLIRVLPHHNIEVQIVNDNTLSFDSSIKCILNKNTNTLIVRILNKE